MLNAPDLSGFNLPKLAADLEATALRQDRCRRLAQSLHVAPEYTGTTESVSHIDADAAATAEAARLVSAVQRFIANETADRSARTNARRPVDPATALRPGFFARTMAALARTAGAEDSRSLSKPPLPRREFQ